MSNISKPTDHFSTSTLRLYELTRTSGHRSKQQITSEWATSPRQALTKYLESKPNRDLDWKFVPRLDSVVSATVMDDHGNTVTATLVLQSKSERYADLEQTLKDKGDIV